MVSASGHSLAAFGCQNETLDAVDPAPIVAAGGIPDPHFGPVVVLRHVHDWVVEADFSAIEPIGVVHDDLPIAKYKPKHSG